MFDISFAGERERFSKFAELSLPINSRWDVTVAARHDDHDDVDSTTARQAATRYRLSDNLALRGSWSAAGKAPLIGALRTVNVITNPTVFDPLTGFWYPVVSINSGNPELEPEQGERISLGFAGELGPMTWSADWYWTQVSNVLSIYSAQQALDLEAAGRLGEFAAIEIVRPYLPPGTSPQGGDFRSIATHIQKPVLDDGEIDSSGVQLRARWDWETDWAAYVLDAHWSYRRNYEYRIFGEPVPAEYPRNRLSATLGITRGVVTAQWSTYGLSGYWDDTRTDRYRRWFGHDLALRWRNPFGMPGTQLVGGILNLDNHSPSINPAIPYYPDETLDSIRGRTFFLSLRKTW